MAEAPANATDSPIGAAPAGPNPRVRIGLVIVAAALLVAGIAYGIQWYTHGRFLESTDDAYLRADQVTVAPRISGYVDQVYVHDNQIVKAEQPLIRIDRRNYQAALSQQTATVDARAADIVAMNNQIAQARAQVALYRAQLAAAEANSKFALQEAARYKSLRDQGVETDERYAQAVNQRDQMVAAQAAAVASLRVAERQVATLESQVDQSKAQLEAVRAAAHTALLNLDDTLIRASIDGRVGDDTARLGEYVQPGTQLMSIVPVQHIYLVANFKETQMGRMQIGQPAAIQIDAFGGRAIDGRVESFAPGTGAQFALLPPENATGNFTKIVQRVPVRISLDVPPDLKNRLVPGLSVTVSVDTSARPRPARTSADSSATGDPN